MYFRWYPGYSLLDLPKFVRLVQFKDESFLEFGVKEK